MRRVPALGLLLLALGVALAIALPAGAVKPDKRPKPTTAAPVAVYLDAGPIWVHEVGDVIRYNLTVQNKTSADVEVNIEFYGDDSVTIGPRDIVTIDNLFTYEVTAIDIAAAADILGTVTVSYYDGGSIVAETSTVVDPVDPCNFDELFGGEVCIWTVDPDDRGVWTVSLTPDSTRRTRLNLSVRDGVPGNWCTVPEDPNTGVVIDRWQPSDETFDIKVYLPGAGGLAFDGLDDGQCYAGGAGGNYFVVGNPDSFYLYTSIDGSATVTHNG